MAMVGGDTDSERFFAFLTLAIRDAGGDVRRHRRRGARARPRDRALQPQLVLGANGHLWAFRYPEHNPLWMLHRAPSDEALVHDDAAGTLHLHSDAAVDHPVVVIASERMDARPGWRGRGGRTGAHRP